MRFHSWLIIPWLTSLSAPGCAPAKKPPQRPVMPVQSQTSSDCAVRGDCPPDPSNPSRPPVTIPEPSPTRTQVADPTVTGNCPQGLVEGPFLGSAVKYCEIEINGGAACSSNCWTQAWIDQIKTALNKTSIVKPTSCSGDEETGPFSNEAVVFCREQVKGGWACFNNCWSKTIFASIADHVSTMK